jgi:hypothetical protein
MGIALFPYQLVCTAQPFGHNSYGKNNPSTCEIMQQPTERLLPSMVCEHISDATDDYSQNKVERVARTAQLVTISVAVSHLANYEIPEQVFLIPSDPKCRMATLLSDSPFRAPPFV